MAISPITIATQGVLNSPLAVAAVRGHLRIELAILEPPRGGDSDGPSYVQGTWKHPYTIKEELRLQIEREDEEILAIIMAFLRGIQ